MSDGFETKDSNHFIQELFSRLKDTREIGPDLGDEFKAFFSEVFFYLRDYSTNNQLLDSKSPRSLRVFMRRTHKGWKKAQELILPRLLDLIEESETLKSQLKLRHKEKDIAGKDECRRKLYLVSCKMLVLRKSIDHIAWTVLNGEISTIRRLAVRGGHTNFSAKNIKDAVDAAYFLNRDLNKIAVVCDATTFIHISDILLFDMATGAMEFIELKTGKKNLAMMEAASMVYQNPDLMHDFTHWMEATDLKHFQRTYKQVTRGKSAMDTINSNKGIDNFTGARVSILETKVPKLSFSHSILDCREKLNSSKFGIAEVDQCLYIGMYRNSGEASVMFSAWMSMINCDAPIVNITSSYLNPHATPLTVVDLPTDLIRELFNGEIILVMALDLDRLMLAANDLYGPVLRFEKPKDNTARKGNQLLNKEGHALVLKTETNEVMLGESILNRVYFGLERPLNFILMTLDGSKGSQK